MGESLSKGFVLLLISQCIFMATGYLINFFLGRYLGPEKYGVYGLIIAVVTIVNLFQTSGMPQSISKSIAESGGAKKTLRKSLKFQVVFSVCLMLLFMALSPLIAILLHDKSLTMFLVYSAFVIPFYASYALYLGFFNGLKDFKKQSIAVSVYSIMKMIFIILLAVYFGVAGAIIGFVVSPIIALLYEIAASRKTPYENGKSNIDMKKLFLTSLPILAFTVLVTMMVSIDLFFVKGILKSNILTGYYNAASVISKIPYYLLTSLGVVLLPGIASAFSSDIKKANSLASASIRWLVIILAPITIIFIMTSKKLITLLFSAAYSDGAYALMILSIAICFATIYYVLASIAIAISKQWLAMITAAVGFVTTVAVEYLLVPTMKLTGAAIGTLSGSIIAAALMSSMLKKNLSYSINPKTLAKILASSIILIVTIFCCEYLIHLLKPNSTNALLLLYAGEIVISVIIFFGALIIFKEINQDDKKMIEKILPKKFSKYVGFFLGMIKE